MIMIRILSQNGNVTVPGNQMYCQIFALLPILFYNFTGPHNQSEVKLVFGVLVFLIYMPPIDFLGCDIM
jgi:hypothetical protein